MQNLIYREEKKLRIEKKLKSIEDLYNLAFQANDTPNIKMKTYKIKLILNVNEKDLTITARQLVKRIKELNRDEEGKILAERLTQVHNQIVNLIRSVRAD